MTKPLVTVVIPCYNYANVVGRAIESVKQQTLSNFECYVVDDGSTDNSQLYAIRAVAGDGRFHLVSQSNSGVAAARNLGVFLGSAPYVCCLDADDEIDPRFLEVCVDVLRSDPSLGIAYTGLWAIRPDGQEGLSVWPDKHNYDAALEGHNQIPTCNVARREIWERLMGQRMRYAPDGAGEEDAEMWLRAGALGYDAVKVTDAGFFRYHWLSGRVSGNRSHKMTDYRGWHPWVFDKQHPFASIATPQRFSHPVRQYDEPTVSVVIPVGAGHERELFDALDSLEAQSFRNWEAIVVFDMDLSDAFVQKFMVAYPYVKVLSTSLSDDEVKVKRGAGVARNLGVAAASGYFLLFLDADDWLAPQAIEKMVKAWDVSDDGIVYTDYYGHAYLSAPDVSGLGERLASYDEASGKAVISYESANYDCELAVRQPHLMPNGQFYIWNLITSLVPKHYHDQIGGFDESMVSWEDWDYWIRMARSGVCFTRIPEKLVVYRFYSGTRRESGLHNAESLIQYLKDKYAKESAQMCGCNKQKSLSPVTNSTAPSFRAAVQAIAQPQARSMPAMNSISDSDFILCLYNHPNRGEHSVIGHTTGKNYGRRSGGDKFLVHKDDIAAFPQIFLPVKPDQPQAPVAAAHPSPPPPPPPPPSPKPAPEPPIPPRPSMEEEMGAVGFGMATNINPPQAEERVQGVNLAHDSFDFQTLPGVTKSIADQLAAHGIVSLLDLVKFGKDNLVLLKGVAETKANIMLDYARDVIEGGNESESSDES